MQEVKPQVHYTPSLGLDIIDRYHMNGDIVINQIDKDNFNTQRIIISNVKLMVTCMGLMADFTLGGNHTMTIGGLEGKRINDIFESDFNGGRFRIHAIARLALAVAKNDADISIIDTESLIAVGAALDLTYINMKFSLEGGSTHNVIRATPGAENTGTTTTTIDIDALKNIQL